MIERFLMWMGFGLCHQLPERSFFAAGFQVPVCARDTGIYVGFVLSVAVIAVLHRRERPSGFPDARGWSVLAVLVGVMLWDGATSYLGIRTTTNALRLATGLAAGYACAALLVPLLNDQLWRWAGKGKVLTPGWRIAAWLVSLGIAFVVLYFGGPFLGLGYPLLVAAAIIATLTAINLVIVGLFPAFDRRAEKPRDLVVPVLVAGLISLAEIWLAGLVRLGLIGVLTALTR